MTAKILSTMIASPAVLWLQAVPDNSGRFTQDQRFELAREAMARSNHAGVNILVPIALFAMIVLIVWIATRRKQAWMQSQIELRKQLLDKFGSAQELATFLESKAGQQFLQDMRWRRGGNRGIWTVGLVLSMVGAALLALTIAGRSHALVVAVVLLAIGVGLLISAAISHKLTKQSGGTIDSGPGNRPVLHA